MLTNLKTKLPRSFRQFDVGKEIRKLDKNYIL